MADKDTLDDAKERFKASSEAESENREAALEDLKFARLGEQWPEDALRQRRSEGRPCLTINRMPAFARQIVNDARMNKPAIRVRPADSQADVKTAEIYNGLIRNIEQSSNADIAYDTALESAVYGGIGYFRVKTDYAHDDTFDLDICIERVANPFTVYGDPASQAADASDWRYGFVTDMLPVTEFKARYKGAKQADWSADGDDKDELWGNEDAVRVAEYWERDETTRPIVQLSSGIVLTAKQYQANRGLFDAQGLVVTGERDARAYKVVQRIMTGAEVLETTEWAGQYIPIIPVYGDEVNIEGKRHFRSMIRDVRDAQRMYNFWRTSTAELVALAPKAPFIAPRGAFDGDPNWKTANTKSHPYLEYEGGVPPQRQPFAGVPAGALQEALNSSDDMKAILGIYDASLGARSNETSGRAILARQREGDVSTFHFIDNLSRAIKYAGRVLIDLIPAVYDKPRMVRVLGEDGTPKTVNINNPQPDPHGNVYELARGKYDLVVEAGPSFSTKRDEMSQFLMEFMRTSPQAGPLIMDMVAKAMDFPESDKIARRFQALLPPQIQKMEAEGEDGANPDALMAQLMQAQTQIQQMGQALQQAQGEQQAAMAKVELEQNKAQAQIALERDKAEKEIALAREVAQAEYELKRAQVTGDMQLKRLDMRQKAAIDGRKIKHRAESEGAASKAHSESREMTQAVMQAMATMNQQQIAALQALIASTNAPKELVRDPATGKAIGVRPIQTSTETE
jgi:hypothetical protein